MQQNQSQRAHFGIQQGYSLLGDFAEISAELALPTTSSDWAVQLWACDGPAATGELDGVMVAEVPVDVAAINTQGTSFVSTQVPATLPVGGRDYAMVMALARRDSDGLAHIHAISNFQNRQWVEGPCLQGAAGYAIQRDTVELSVDAVHNPRSGNVSGTLALELWAFSKPYDGRQQQDGQHLAGLELPCLLGQSSHVSVGGTAAFRAPLPGRWHMALLLREWTASGYVTRDYRAFDVMYDNAAADVETTLFVEPVDARICLNTGLIEELAALPGLTKKLAQEIVRSRPFSAVDDLISVRGIGDKTLRKVRGSLKI